MKITVLQLKPGNLEKWMHQNNAKYTGVFFPGTLQDNFILECRRGYAFCYEKPLNCWTSTHNITFIPYKLIKTDPYTQVIHDRMWAEFYARQDAAETETA